jgi:RNA polymerase sigma factor (sigma-70 family)
MTSDCGGEPEHAEESPPLKHAWSERSQTGPDDAFLIQSMLGGDAVALHTLMARYDRLVRFTIFRISRQRCRQDPHWVDSIASETWAGFVRSMQRDPGSIPGSVSKYLMQTARNRSISALRTAGAAQHQTLEDGGEEEASLVAGQDEDPLEQTARLEELEALRDCVSRLDETGQRLYGQIGAITERRWREAAEALGLAESTLRSQWKKAVQALRQCMAGKRSAKRIAPRPGNGDSYGEGGALPPSGMSEP